MTRLAKVSIIMASVFLSAFYVASEVLAVVGDATTPTEDPVGKKDK